VYQYCSKKNEDTLHILFCSNEYYSNYKNKIINTLQAQVISLVDRDIFPLCILENILSLKYIELDGVLSKINLDLEHFRLKNSWYEFVPISLLN